MEVRLTPEKEAQLHQFASRAGRDASELVEESVDRLLEYNVQFIAAVKEGREAANGGDLLEHDDVVERIEKMFRS